MRRGLSRVAKPAAAPAPTAPTAPPATARPGQNLAPASVQAFTAAAAAAETIPMPTAADFNANEPADDKPKPAGPRFSTRTQWQERITAPVATRTMTGDEVEEFRMILCSIEDGENYLAGKGVEWEFVPILDPNDEERDDMINLIYRSRARRGPGGVCVPTDIWTFKLPIPPHIKKQRDDIRRARSAAPPVRRRRPMIAGPGQQ